MSPAARKMLASDFAHRYCIPPRGQRPEEIWDYPNQTYSRQIEEIAKEIACTLFHGAYADVRPLSGNNIVSMIFPSLTKRGDVLLSVPPSCGGHFSTKSIAELFGLKHLYLPYDNERGEIDVEACAKLAGDFKPKLIYLDASMILFPHPVEHIRNIFGDAVIIAYDASHCFGVIAGRAFQAPLLEGADLISGSTHKTMFGPQKGLIVSRKNDAIAQTIQRAITPLFVSNPHVHHIASLAVALEELSAFGRAYAKRVVSNAKLLGRVLYNMKIPIMFAARDFTECHQLICLLDSKTEPLQMVQRFEDAGIHVNGIHAPFSSRPGLRLGVAELTRRGFQREAMTEVASMIGDILLERRSVWHVRERVRDISLAHPALVYGFNEVGEPLDAP